MPQPIYLDHQATTPCDARVVDAMVPYWSERYGNAASHTHRYGWQAAEAVEMARGQVAALIGATAREIVFTSGATEADSLAILGTARALRSRGDHLLTCATEHPAVLDACRALEKEGFRVTRLPVDASGRLRLSDLEAAIEPGTVLVSIMHGNNEIGVIQPLEQIVSRARSRGVLVHTDAAQSAGKIPLDVAQLGVDLLSFSAHKIYGPKGIGALYLRQRRPALRLAPIQFGGGHEHGLRSGTLPVPLCVGFGMACQIAHDEGPDEAKRLRGLRERLWKQLCEGLEGVELNGHPEQRLPGNLNVSFRGVEAQALLIALPGLALSTGSACTSSTPEPSHVLRALGFEKSRVLSSVRIGFGRGNDESQIDQAAAAIIEQVGRLRALARR